MLNMDIQSCPLEDSEDALQEINKQKMKISLRTDIEDCMAEDSEDALEALLLEKNK
jgi:hypothetical protein